MIQVFAPGSIANFFVGFDILGLAFDSVGDTIILKKASGKDLKLIIENSTSKIPIEPEKNTAGKSALSLLNDFKISTGLEMTLQKGIPMSSGLGGSAASAVGMFVAINELYQLGLTTQQLLHYALNGEEVASGARHADNVAPCLLGGMQLLLESEPLLTQIFTLPRNLLSSDTSLL